MTGLVLAAVVYVFIVKPYTAARERYFPAEEEGTAADVVLLQEIRDLLAAGSGARPHTEGGSRSRR